jgi:hypothetical protein
VAPAPTLPSPTPAPAPGPNPVSAARMDAISAGGTTQKVVGEAGGLTALAKEAAPSLAAAGLSSGLSLGLAPTPEMPGAPSQSSGSGLAARDRERRRRAQGSRSTIRSSLGSAMGARTGRTTLGGGY